MKKAQVWILDVFFALMIFVAVLVIFFRSELNLSDNDEQALDEMMFESKLVSDSLLSTGFPRDWNSSNVTEIGIANNYRINLTKLDRLQQMGYTATKSRLRTKFDYYFYFESVDGIMPVGSTEGYGKPLINSTNILGQNPHNLVSLSRFAIFRSRPVRMVIFLWN
jgi:hypothetical protein